MASEYISIGLSVLDYVFLCEEAPRGSVTRAADHIVQGGGLAATAPVAIARLGGRGEIWTRVGDDSGGRLILEQFRQEGVDVSHAKVCPGGHSPACVVLVDRRAAERHFTYYPGRGLDPSPESLDLGRLDRAKAVLVDCFWPEAQLPAARRARQRGVPVCGDIEGIDEQTIALIRHMDYPIYSAECAREYARTDSPDDDLRELAGLGGKVPMITLGADGCIWLEAGQVRRCPAFRAEVVDTTGCGDVFHGAFTFGLGRGWDVGRNARFASAAAALKCRALGGRAGIPTYDEVVEFLRKA